MDIPKEDDLDVTSVPQVGQRSFTQLAAEKIGEFVGSIAGSTQHDLSIKYNAHSEPITSAFYRVRTAKLTHGNQGPLKNQQRCILRVTPVARIHM